MIYSEWKFFKKKYAVALDKCDRKFYNKCMRNEIKVSHALILF